MSEECKRVTKSTMVDPVLHAEAKHLKVHLGEAWERGLRLAIEARKKELIVFEREYMRIIEERDTNGK